MSDATDPWSGWHAETVERGSKALNERDQARAWVVALESRLAEVRARHREVCIRCERGWHCPTVVAIDAPLEATE